MGKVDTPWYRILHSLHLDRFLYNLQVIPFAHELVLRWVFRSVQFFEIEILNVRLHICDAPGQVLIVANDDQGCTWKGKTDTIETTAMQPILIPWGWHLQIGMRIVSQNGHTGRGAVSLDNPVIAAPC